MKKSRIYLITLLLFVFAAGFIVVKYKKDGKNKAASFYPLKDRDKAREAMEANHLHLSSSVIDHTVTPKPEDAEALKKALMGALKPE